MHKFLETIIALPNRLLNAIEFIRKKVKIGRKVVVNGHLHLHGDGLFIINDGVHINSSSFYNPTAGNSTHLMAFKGAKIEIGKNSGISNSRIIARNSVIIKENVLVGADCIIMDNDMHSQNYFIRREDRNADIASAGIIIKSDAFIGARCIILKGVTIGERSIVGAGSVVTKNIPDGEIWAGNPAKYIRQIVLEDNNGES